MSRDKKEFDNLYLGKAVDWNTEAEVKKEYKIMTDIIRLYEKGLTVSQIARKLSLKALFVYNVLKDYLKGKEEK